MPTLQYTVSFLALIGYGRIFILNIYIYIHISILTIYYSNYIYTYILYLYIYIFKKLKIVQCTIEITTIVTVTIIPQLM